jgi:DNA-binding transcriptional MerR regulator
LTARKEQSGDLLQIGQAAKKAGVSVQSVQNYIMLGLLKPTQLTPGGRRLFDREAVERIVLIHKMNQSGYTLRAIRELFVQRFGQPKESRS